MINKIIFYDKELVDLIINDFNFLKKNLKNDKNFWGYKVDTSKKYFSFFSLYIKKLFIIYF